MEPSSPPAGSPTGPEACPCQRLEDRLLPLPRRVACHAWQALTPDRLCVAIEGDDLTVRRAADELAAFLSRGTGGTVPVVSAGAEPADAFRLVIGQGPHDAVPITGYQAYAIVPFQGGLRLIGREPIGAYYAVKTLKQAVVVEPGVAHVPHVAVSDYADLAERGFWDYFYPAPIRPTMEMHTLSTPERWFAFLDDLSDYKVNLLDLLIWDEGLYYNSARYPELVEPGTPDDKNDIVRAVMAYARGRGIRIVLNFCHPEHFARMRSTYPELGGVNPTGVQQRLLDMLFCVSHPKTREIFAGITEEVVELFEPDAVLVWMPENLGRCTCDRCMRHGYLRQFFSIYREATQRLTPRHPGLSVRYMVSYLHHHDTVLRMVPDDAELVYYECDGHGMYGQDEHKRLPEHLAAQNRSGRRMLGCVNFRGVGEQYVPLPYLDTVAEWVRLLVRDGYYGVDGSIYSNPGVNRLNILRMADVAWNAHGRETRDYLRAYATCHHQPAPAAWARAVHALSNGWEQYHRKWGRSLEGAALDWLLAERELDTVDVLVMGGALEHDLLPALWQALVGLDTAADIARRLADDDLGRQVRACRIRLGSLYHILGALRVRDPDPWDDPEVGPCQHWVAAFQRHLACARDLLVGLPEVTRRIVSRMPHVEGDPAVSADKLVAKIDQLLEPTFLERLAKLAPYGLPSLVVADGSQDPQEPVDDTGADQ